jgi:hypothetical protein
MRRDMLFLKMMDKKFWLLVLVSVKDLRQSSHLPSCNVSFQDPVIRLTLDRTTSHGCPGISPEAISIESQVFCCFFVQWIRGVGLEEEELDRSNLSTTKTHGGKQVSRTCIPTMTAFRLRTGFQSSRRMFKQTLPSRSILG